MMLDCLLRYIPQTEDQEILHYHTIVFMSRNPFLFHGQFDAIDCLYHTINHSPNSEFQGCIHCFDADPKKRYALGKW